jgi:hypothetical protein
MHSAGWMPEDMLEWPLVKGEKNPVAEQLA